MLYFVINEKSRSGKGAAVWQEVKGVLKERNIPYQAWTTAYEYQAIKLAEDICKQEDDDICLVALGGDGTANEVVNGITDFEKVRFGIIPTGSGNDFARGLKIKGTPKENLERILTCMEMGPDAGERIDLGKVSWNHGENSRLFVISSGIGMDALVCKKALTSKLKKALNKMHLGKLTYLFLTIYSLFSMDTADASVKYDEKGRRNLKKTIFSAVMNFPAEGGGVPMAPKADARDGKFCVTSAYGVPKLITFFYLIFLMASRHEGLKGVDLTECRSCDYQISKPMVLHADGEICGNVTDAHFECLPQKLRLLL